MTQKSPEKILQEAEILIKTGNPEKQVRADKLLRQILNKYPGSSYATQAKQLLTDLSRHFNSPPLRENSELAKRLSHKWAGINSYTNAQLHPFLEQLFDPDLSAGITISRLRDEVIHKLKQWILEIKDEKWLNDLMNPIQQHPNFKHHLDESLENWRLKELMDKYHATRIPIENALQNWDCKTANSLIAEWRNAGLPSDLQNQIAEFQQAIGAIDNDKQQLETLLNRIQSPNCFVDEQEDSWIRLQECLKHCQQLQAFQNPSNYLIPKNWQAKIDEVLSVFLSHIEVFLKNKAQAGHDFSAVRRFYQELNNTTEQISPWLLSLSKHEKGGLKRISSLLKGELPNEWFNLAQANYQKHNDNELQLAKSITDLEHIRQQILAEKKSLPAELAQWLQNRANAVSALIHQWDTLETGTEWIENRESPVVVPDELQQKIVEYQKWWQKLQKIKQQIAPENIPTENDFKMARNELERLATLYPQHQLIQTLLSEVKINSQCYRFDEALEQWDIEKFLDLCQQTPSTEIVQPYLQLVQYQKYLPRLKRLAQQEPSSDFQPAATWWQDWQRTIRQLGTEKSPLAPLYESGEFPPLKKGGRGDLFLNSLLPKLPAPFVAQLQTITTERKTALFALLDALLENPDTTANDCNQVAETLERFQADSNDFSDYYRKFKCFARQQYIQEYIDNQKWELATEALEQFQKLGGDKDKAAQFTKTIEQLKISQILTQAEAESLNKLADVLKEQWFLVTCYLPDKVVESLLEKTTQHSWQNHDQERLSTLTQLASQINHSESFRLWLDWLNIEAAFEKEKSPPPPFNKVGSSPLWRVKRDLSLQTLSDFIKLIFQQNQQAEIRRDENNHVFLHEKLREPLKQLVKQWQNENDLLFIWFYNASQRIHPPLIHEAVEPLTQLEVQSVNIATQVKKQLESTDISDTDLANAQKTLQSEQTLWQRLIDYNKLLPFEPVRQPKVPLILDEMNELVEKLLQIKQQFVALEDADLREMQPQRQLNEITNFIQNHLTGFQIHQSWQKRADALEPLTRLTFTLSQFAKATLCFGAESKTYFGKTQHTPHPSQEGNQTPHPSQEGNQTPHPSQEGNQTVAIPLSQEENQTSASPLLRGDLGVCYFENLENWECEALDPLDKKHDWLGEMKKHLLGGCRT